MIVILYFAGQFGISHSYLDRLEVSLYPWNEPHFLFRVLMNVIFLMYPCISFAGTLHPYSSEIRVCSCLFSELLFPGFSSRVTLDS